MSPLDDELRAALHGRATVLTPSPDPLAGIERRARRIRRNRAATAVAGSVLAVAAVALVVPALSPGATTAPVPPGSSPTAMATTPAPASLLDADAPWPYRGDDAVRQSLSEEASRQWAQEHRVDDVTWSPLFGQVYVPSGQAELVFLAVARDERWYGLARSSEAGAEIVRDVRLTAPTAVVALALAGDEGVGRLLAVSAPGTTTAYGPDVASELAPLAELADGVGITALEGDPATDVLQVRDADGEQVARTPAPDVETAPATGEPDNLLGWPFRGVHDEALEQRAVAAYAAAKGVDDVGHRVLSTGGTEGGLAWTVLEGWVPGQRAQVFGWVERPDGSTEPVLQPVTEPDEPVVALLLTGVPGRTTDELVVVPTPLTGQVLSTDAAGTERPVEAAPGFDSVVLVDRELDAQGDRLRVLDGDGDLGQPLFEGTVFELLCGEKGCG